MRVSPCPQPPTSFSTRIDSSLVACVSLSLSVHVCAVVTVHWIPLTTTGQRVPGQGFWTDGAVESAGARICREAGARETTNQMVRDMDLAVHNPRDGRRLEIVADGLPLFGRPTRGGHHT